MRRLLALAAALAIAASPLAVGGQAMAKDHHDEGGGRGGEGRWSGGAPGGWRGGGEGRGPPEGRGPGGGHWERGGEPPGGGRWDRGERGDRGEPRYEPRYDPRYERSEPRGYGPPPQAYAPPRRGGYLGPQGGAPIEDPSRYRLRSAPRGYQWMRVPGGMALVSQATGQVFDVVPY
ncbi:MAG: RcnB family protein [Phenylobacterium sp.]